MGYERVLEIAAAVLAIGGAIWGSIVLLAGKVRRVQRRQKLEQYLREEKALRCDQGRRTVTHLMARLGMTENEVLDTAFRSKVVRRTTSVDESGRAGVLMFEYDDIEDLNRRRDKRAAF